MQKGFIEPSRQPRLGLINFINSLPISLPIAKGLVAVEAEVHFGTPQELNRSYADNSLDLGVMSTFFYLQSSDLNIISDLSISSSGAVGSVLFFSKVPLNHGRPMRIAASSASATSVNLLSVLLQEEHKIVPSFSFCRMPDLSDPQCDGALVIGDHALNVDAQWSMSSQRFDLGSWWSTRYNLPMVFAVWAAKADWQKLHKDECDGIASSLKSSLDFGLGSAFDQVVAEAVDRSSLSASRLERYFRSELDFCFSSEHLAGLNRYKSLCEKHGLFGHGLPDRQLQGVPLG